MKNVVTTLFVGSVLLLAVPCHPTESDQSQVAFSKPVYTETPEALEKAVITACKDARHAFAKHQSRYIVCGLPAGSARKIAEFLKTKYAIVPDFTGCVVTESKDQYALVYNEMTRRLFLTEHDIDLDRECEAILQKGSPNQAAEPSRTTVTAPAGAGARASGAPGSP